MTAANLLTTIKTAVAAALTGWTVYDHPAADAADKVADLRLETGTLGGYTFGGHQVVDVVVLRLMLASKSSSATMGQQYRTLIDRRDTASIAVMDALKNVADLKPFPQQQKPIWDEPAITMSASQAGFWMCELKIPIERKLP